MDQRFCILVINGGSTSTKVAVYENEQPVYSVSLKHTPEELAPFATIWDQEEYRRERILGYLNEIGYPLDRFDAIVTRGGNMKAVAGGIYEITPEMIDDMKSGIYGSHACSVANEIVYQFGQQAGIPVVTVDPPVTDELCDSARFSGIPQITRLSSFHALSQKATARKLSAQLGRKYEDLNLIVAHMGGGVSVGSHCHGRVIDVNNALDGDGPFTPERAGTLPNGDLIKMCFSGKYTERQLLRLMNGRGGLLAYLGTTDCIEIEKRIAAGDAFAEKVYHAMAYQISKEIGAAGAVLCGKVDAIAITGSLAYSDLLMKLVGERIGFLAPIHLFPGENEMESLASGALRYLRGTEAPKPYPGEYPSIYPEGYLETVEVK